MPYEPLHHKYRPQTFAELVGQESVATTLTNALRQQRIAPAYLFTGARGTGKTSSARILAKSLNCLESSTPTEKPCGKCEVCRMIANGSALDVIEIDAASNTGVDNIRELIERAQFAPVQCRYKVYVVDECLTGDSLVLTDQGLVRIDDPTLKDRKVLSYNDALSKWEFKPVVRWLDQGKRQTYIIRTSNQEIQCTGNHLIRTEQGWIAAKDVKEGTKILSPVNVDVAQPSSNLEQMVAFANLPEGISLGGTATGKKHTAWILFWSKLRHCVLSVLVDAVRSWMFRTFYSVKGEALAAFDRIGSAIPTGKNTESGNSELHTLSLKQRAYPLKFWDSSTAPCWETAPLATPTNTVAFHDYRGLMEQRSRNGWSTKRSTSRHCDRSLEYPSITDMENNQLVVVQPAIQNWLTFSELSNLMDEKRLSLWTGSIESLQKDWLGGTWMMDLFTSVLKEVHRFNSILKDIQLEKINSWLSGLLQWGIPPKQNPTFDRTETKRTITSGWEQTLPEGGCWISNSTQFPQWTTNLETVESVHLAGIEQVYDIEVEDNHNFVANGLLVHNCHMLSTAAFNALLKTLEEPPDRVVFVLATTDPQRVLPTIISRCQRFDFRRIPLEAMVQHMSKIADKEAIDITPDAIQLIAQISQGGLRDAQSLLDQLSLLEGQITAERVWDLVGAVPERDLLALVQAIARDDATTVIDRTRRLMDRGREPLIVLQNLASFYRDLLIAKTSPDRQDLIAVTASTWVEMCEFAQSLDLSTILQGQQHLRESEGQVKNTTQPRLWLEVTLMGLLPSALREGRGQQAESTGQERRPSGTVVATGVAVQRQREVAISPQPQVEVPRPPTVVRSEEVMIAESVVTPETQTQPEGEREQTLVETEWETNAPGSPSVPASQDIEQEQIQQEQIQQAQPSYSIDLEQIWQEVIAQIKFRGTQVLLQQQALLLAFDGKEARIGIKSQPLFQMAKKQLANIEGAFEAVYQRRVRVSLEVSTVAESSPRSLNGTSNGAAAPTASLPPRKPTVKESAAPPSAPAKATGSASPGYMPSPPTVAAPLPDAPGAPEPTPSSAWQEDEVKGAARSVAQFFNGEIISLENEPPAPQAGEVSLTPEISDLDEVDGDPDEDVPF